MKSVSRNYLHEGSLSFTSTWPNTTNYFFYLIVTIALDPPYIKISFISDNKENLIHVLQICWYQTFFQPQQNTFSHSVHHTLNISLPQDMSNFVHHTLSLSHYRISLILIVICCLSPYITPFTLYECWISLVLLHWPSKCSSQMNHCTHYFP